MAKSFDIINTNIELFTLDTDGTEAFELPGSHWDRNRIGEYKKLKLYFNTAPYLPQSIAGLTIYISPALCYQIGASIPFGGAKPSECWSFMVDAYATPGTYSMIQNVASPNPVGLTTNYEVSLVIVDSDDFQIHIKYFQLYDLKAFMNSALEVNRYKLLKDKPGSGTILTVSGASVYNNVAFVPQFYLFIQDDSNIAINSNLNIAVNGYTAGFYGKNAHETSPYFTNETFSLSDGTNPVTSLLVGQDTQFEFTFDSLGFPDSVLLWLIRVDSNDQTVDFITNYEASFINCQTTVGTATIDNKFKSPSTGVTLVGGTTYKVNVWIDNTLLAFNQKYRIIAIPYYTATLTEYNVNSFISDEYTVSPLPKFTGVGYDFTGSIQDYLNEYYGNDLICVIEERLKSKLDIAYYYNGFSDDIFNRLGLTVTNDIRRYLTQVMVEVYETTGVTTQYFERLIANKIDPVTYQVPTGLTLNFNSDDLLIEYDFRVRYESWVSNIQTIVSGTPLLNANDDQNWAGRILTIKYSLLFYYDDYSVPFNDTVVFEQTIRPKDYDPAKIVIYTEAGATITDSSYYCSDVDSCFKANLTEPNPEEYKLITTIDQAPGSINSIEETEEFTGLLTQEISTKILSQEINYSDSEATYGKFCLDNSEFLLDKIYKISAIAKRDAPCTYATGQLLMGSLQDGDICYIGARSYTYELSGDNWTNQELETYTVLADCVNADSLAEVVAVQNAELMDVTAIVCGTAGNIAVSTDIETASFIWNNPTLTGGTG